MKFFVKLLYHHEFIADSILSETTFYQKMESCTNSPQWDYIFYEGSICRASKTGISHYLCFFTPIISWSFQISKSA